MKNVYIKKEHNKLLNRGITLIALIITIIILLILAGVAIHFTLGENGILRNAETAGKKYSEASVKETIQNILVDMQTEEIKNGHKLDLAKVAMDLASKDKNIKLEAFNEGDTELKGTYTINGQEYEFTINNKFETTVTVPTGEKIVKIENITWENGKPKVELSSNQTGTIEYKDTDGTWKPYDESVNVNNGDTLTIRVNTGSGTTKEETIVIQDKVAPTEFEIEIASEFIKSKSVTVNLKTTPQDKETGLKDYTYVIEGGEGKKEIENITTTSYTITNLTPETNYSVYVLAFDYAGNYRKSNVVTITTLGVIPPSASVGGTTHTAKKIDYEWEELSRIAKVISDNYGTTVEGKINNDTAEVNISIDGENITLGIGDWKTLNGKKVRILGFNHDLLTNTNAYGESETNTYAGISFEFAECLTTAIMNSSNTTSGGWRACTLRGTLNNTTINSLENKEYIKEVNKQYIAIYNKSNSVTTSNDKLWLLSCSEIWKDSFDSSAVYGYAIAKEGERYKYYKNINATAKGGNGNLIKKNDGTAVFWWLRSPWSAHNTEFSDVTVSRG